MVSLVSTHLVEDVQVSCGLNGTMRVCLDDTQKRKQQEALPHSENRDPPPPPSASSPSSRPHILATARAIEKEAERASKNRLVKDRFIERLALMDRLPAEISREEMAELLVSINTGYLAQLMEDMNAGEEIIHENLLIAIEVHTQ